jgi:hypothetical protein
LQLKIPTTKTKFFCTQTILGCYQFEFLQIFSALRSVFSTSNLTFHLRKILETSPKASKISIWSRQTVMELIRTSSVLSHFFSCRDPYSYSPSESHRLIMTRIFVFFGDFALNSLFILSYFHFVPKGKSL